MENREDKIRSDMIKYFDVVSDGYEEKLRKCEVIGFLLFLSCMILLVVIIALFIGRNLQVR